MVAQRVNTPKSDFKAEDPSQRAGREKDHMRAELGKHMENTFLGPHRAYFPSFYLLELTLREQGGAS